MDSSYQVYLLPDPSLLSFPNSVLEDVRSNTYEYLNARNQARNQAPSS